MKISGKFRKADKISCTPTSKEDINTMKILCMSLQFLTSFYNLPWIIHFCTSSQIAGDSGFGMDTKWDTNMYPFLDYLSSLSVLYCLHQLCSSHTKLFSILPNTRIFHPLLRLPFFWVLNLSFNYSSFSVLFFILNTYLNYFFLWEIFNGPFKWFYTIFVQSTTIPPST